MSEPVTIVLREIHRRRRHLRDLQEEINLGPRVMKIQEAQLEEQRKTHKQAYDIIKKLKIQQNDAEVTLQQTEMRLAKLNAELNTATSKKEFAGKQTEIDHANNKKEGLEDLILGTLTDIEERTADLPNVEERWANAQAEFEQFKVDAHDRLNRMQNDKQQTETEVAEWEAKIPDLNRPSYDRLIRNYGPDGLAAVKGKSCQHCRSSLTEQQRLEVGAGRFVICSNCARALYMAEEST